MRTDNKIGANFVIVLEEGLRTVANDLIDQLKTHGGLAPLPFFGNILEECLHNHAHCAKNCLHMWEGFGGMFTQSCAV
jgi:hypothetical protein